MRKGKDPDANSYIWPGLSILEAYPGGMHRMHVHPPPPPMCIPPRPCSSPPPPAMFIPPPRWKAGYEKTWGSGQQEKNASWFPCDLKIFCRVSLYIKNSLLIFRMEQADSRTVRVDPHRFLCGSGAGSGPSSKSLCGSGSRSGGGGGGAGG
jgi:hypothetical protein